MATLLQNQDDQDNQQPPVLAPAAAPIAPATPQAAPQQQGSSSGKFVNLQKYLNANANSNNVGAVVNKAQEKSQQTQQELGNKAQQFGQQVQQGTTQYNQDLSSSIIQDPSAFLANQAQKSALQNIAQGYKGPQTTEFDINPFQQQAGNLRNLQQLSGTEKGRFEVLGQLFQKPEYNTGQKRLDQLLLQRQPGSLEAVQTGLGSAATGAEQAVSGTQQQVAQQVAAAQKASEEARARTQSDISGAYGNTMTEVQKQLALQQAAQNQSIEDATKAFRAGNISEELFNNLNISGQNRSGVQSLVNEANALGVNPADYIKIKAGQEANIYTAANTGQAGRLSALQNIAGLAGTQVGQGQNWGAISGSTNKFNPGALTSDFNSGALQNAIAQIRDQQAKAAAAKQQQFEIDRLSGLQFFK